MKIEVNNGREIAIETTKFNGISVKTLDAHGEVEDRDVFEEGEIVMAINLLRYMKLNDRKSAWIMNDQIEKYLSNLIDNGDLEEFRIFQ